MLETQCPLPGLIFLGILYRSDLFSEELFTDKVEKLLGKMNVLRPTFNPLGAYYAKEMGEEEKLKRFFLVSTTAYPREFLLSIKLLSLEWEKEWSTEAKRMVNVDVGLLSAENFLLATTKNYSHRIFIGQNIFADLTYQYQGGSFQTLPWTYPDFKDQEKVDFFNQCRTVLLVRSVDKSP